MKGEASARVLVVDDDDFIRESLCEMLEEEGFATAAASDGAEALSWLRNHPQDACIVLLDLMMPVMDGFEFLKLKECEPSLSHVPVLVITAAGPIVEAKLRANHNVHACLAKPLKFDRLLKSLHQCHRSERRN